MLIPTAPPIEVKDLIAMFFERSTAAQTLWFDYATVVLLLLAFIVAVKKPKLTRTFRAVLIVAFLAFAFVNLWAQLDVNKQRNAIVEILSSRSDVLQDAKLVKTLSPLQAGGVEFLHVTADLVVCAAIIFLNSREN
jgi:hypothetical protein